MRGREAVPGPRANSCYLRSHPDSLPEGIFFLIIISGEGLYDFVLFSSFKGNAV